MSADVTRIFPIGGDADDLIRKSVRAYMAFRGLNVEQLAPMSDMSVATLYRKLAGKGATQAFRAGEVASIAHALEVEVGQLYSGLAGGWGPRGGPGTPAGNPSGSPLRVGCPSRDLTHLAAVA